MDSGSSFPEANSLKAQSYAEKASEWSDPAIALAHLPALRLRRDLKDKAESPFGASENLFRTDQDRPLQTRSVLKGVNC